MSSTNPMLLFFTDPRSGPGRRMDSLLAHLAGKTRGRLTLRRVDVARNPALVERLRVQVVPTLLLVKDRRVVGRLEGQANAPKIERMLEPHLGELTRAA